MTYTQQFIEDAIKGGWKHEKTAPILTGDEYFGTLFDPLLDPLAWQAVGKTRGWYENPDATFETKPEWQSEWRHKLHYFIDHLADGLSIEEALGKLST